MKSSKEMKSLNSQKVAWEFEVLSSEILEKNGMSLRSPETDKEKLVSVDFITKDDKTVIECRVFGSNSHVFKTAMTLDRARNVLNASNAILMTPNQIPAKVIHQVEDEFNVKVWDFDKLVEITESYPKLMNGLNEIYSQITFKKSEFESIGLRLKRRLKRLPTGRQNKYATEYENLCRDILNFLFPEELSLPEVRRKGRGNLNIRDITCYIKSDQGFWKRVICDFNSRLLVAECKNLKGGPDQKSIVQLMKYLFAPAFRTFGLVCSRAPASNSAQEMRRVAWLESKKIILFVDDEMFEKMIDMKSANLDPSEQLEKQLEEFLFSLEA